MNDLEPTQETIAWIYKNAEQAWQEGDPKKLQFWEDQKKEFQKKCYHRIESLVKQRALLQQQQEALIQKVKNGEYSPEEANQIHQQIYNHNEEVKRQIQFYRKLLQYPTDETSPILEEIHGDTPIDKRTIQEIPLQNVVPVEKFLQMTFRSILRAVFISNIGQMSICFLILVISVYLIWTWNTKNQQPLFKYTPLQSEHRHIIYIHNQAMLNTKLCLTQQNQWEFAPYVYLLECSAETTSGQKKTYLQIPLNCLFIDDGLFTPVTNSYIQISPGSEKSFIMDTQCIKQNFPEITKITITIRKLLFRTVVLNTTIDLPETPS